MSTPWTKALALPSDDEALSALVRVPPQPLKGVAGMNPVEAAETLEAALKTVYLASAQDLRLIRSIVALGAVHARTFYADTSQFIAKAKGKPNLPPDPPIRMLTGPSGVGKSELLKAVERAVGRHGPVHPSADLPPFPVTPVARVAVRSEVSRAALLSNLAEAIGLDEEFGRSLDKYINYLRLRSYQHGLGAVLADELQFASRSNTASAFVAQLLTSLADIGPPLVYACNYSLGHKLKRRPPEDRARFMTKPYLMLSLLPSDPAFVGLLEDAAKVFDGGLAIDPKADAQEIHAMTYGLRRMVVRLLVAGYRVAREEQGNAKKSVSVTMEHVRAGYKSIYYEDERRDVTKSFEAQLGLTDDTDYLCPFEVSADEQATLRKLADHRQQLALNRAVDERSAASGSRTPDKKQAGAAQAAGSPAPKAKGNRMPPVRSAADLLAGLQGGASGGF